MNKKYNCILQIKGEAVKNIGSVVQFDTNNKINFSLVDGSAPFNISGCDRATLTVLKPDGKLYITDDVVISNAKNGKLELILLYELTPSYEFDNYLGQGPDDYSVDIRNIGGKEYEMGTQVCFFGDKLPEPLCEKTVYNISAKLYSSGNYFYRILIRDKIIALSSRGSGFIREYIPSPVDTAGSCLCTLEIFINGERISSSRFSYEVIADLSHEGSFSPSETGFPVINSMIKQVNDLNSHVQNSENARISAEADRVTAFNSLINSGTFNNAIPVFDRDSFNEFLNKNNGDIGIAVNDFIYSKPAPGPVIINVKKGDIWESQGSTIIPELKGNINGVNNKTIPLNDYDSYMKLVNGNIGDIGIAFNDTSFLIKPPPNPVVKTLKKGDIWEKTESEGVVLRGNVTDPKPPIANYNSLWGIYSLLYSNIPVSSDTYKWYGGVLAPNGKIYCVPHNATNAGIIDPALNTINTTSITGLSTSTGKWYGGVLAPNGKIYCVPHAALYVLIIDPVTNTVNTTSITGLVGSNKWVGGVLAPNGKIYCVPRNSESVLIIDPATNTVDTTTITGLTTTANKWAGGVLAPNGKIYCVPVDATNVLIIDPATNTVDTTSITGLTGTNKWYGGVLAPNGKIYCVPRNSTNVLIIDPEKNTADTTSITGLTGTSKWVSGVLAPNGKIYCIPNEAANVLIIDPETNTADRESISVQTGINKWVGGILFSNGKIYCIPSDAANALVINETPEVNPFAIDICLSPNLNKF